MVVIGSVILEKIFVKVKNATDRVSSKRILLYTSESILLRDYFVPNFVEMTPIVLDLFEKAFMTCIFIFRYFIIYPWEKASPFI